MIPRNCQKIFDRVASGEPAVVFDQSLLQIDPQSKEEPWSFLERSNLKQSYLTTDQLMDRQTILAAFDAEIGIQTLPYNKKERLVTAEAESRTNDATARLMVWKATLDTSIELVNQMFNTDIKAEFTYNVGGEEDVTGENNIDRP